MNKYINKTYHGDYLKGQLVKPDLKVTYMRHFFTGYFLHSAELLSKAYNYINEILRPVPSVPFL